MTSNTDAAGGGSNPTSASDVGTTTTAIGGTSSSGADSSAGSGDDGGGLKGGARIAVAVVVPIVAVTLLVLGLLFWWRRRKERLANEEQRKQELDDYSYTPHANPTIPAMAGQYVPKEDRSGYRGWGTTMAGRQNSTVLSNGFADASTSDAAEAGMVGAGAGVGTAGAAAATAAAHTRGTSYGSANAFAPAPADGNIQRGVSNASSQYSAPDDISDGMAYSGPPPGIGGGAAPPYYEAYNPYEHGSVAPGGVVGSPPGQSAPVIRDNPARRNPARIEAGMHYPQQTGISQNF